ncbi:MAG TPA: hypothetical protein EYN70_04975 [Planctomycetaceae bacterium]|nr:hypothetical protein [Planctomycetaceae bacterium]
MIGKVSAVFRYELKQSFGLGMTISWLLIILFPAGLQQLINSRAMDSISIEVAGLLVAILIPGAVCLLSGLMSMSSFLHAELEGNTWPYVAVRPQGRVTMMFGKYLVSVTRSIMAGFLALMVMLPLTSHTLEEDFGLLVMTSSALVVLSSISYSSLFCLLGTIMHKRPMILAVIYMIAMEGVISVLPAVVNKITIHYYLRSLLVRWMQWDISNLPILSDANIFSVDSTLIILFCLLGINVGCLAVSMALLRNREYHVGDVI